MRKIKGFPDYRIDTSGRVWSFRNVRKNANGQPIPRKLRPVLGRKGQVRYKLINKKGRFTRPIEKIMLETYVRPAKHGEVPFHKDGNPRNNKLKNLTWEKKKDLPVKMFNMNMSPEDKRLKKHIRRQIRLYKAKQNYGE